MATLEDLGRQVHEKRDGRGIRAVAKEIGISHATLSRVERGHLPDLENYQKICRWLGVEMVPATEVVMKGGEPRKIPEVHFRKQPTVSPATAQALAEMILAAQSYMEEQQEREVE